MKRSDMHDTHLRPRPAARLHAETVGAGPSLVLAHGFTQTGATCGADGRRPGPATTSWCLVDLPGHGGSSDVQADLSTGAQLLSDVGGSGTYLGYSMGGRFCLHAALTRPDLVQRLVLISATAGIDDEGERRDRVAADEALADRLDPPFEAGPGPDDQERLDAFLQRWLARPLFAGIPAAVAGLAERRSNTTAGLASSLRLAGTGTQLPLWERLPLLEMPVLIITGEGDPKFTVLGRRMSEAIGDNATHTVVPGVGHTAHLEDPDGVTAVIRAHLAAGG